MAKVHRIAIVAALALAVVAIVMSGIAIYRSKASAEHTKRLEMRLESILNGVRNAMAQDARVGRQAAVTNARNVEEDDDDGGVGNDIGTEPFDVV